MHFETEMKKYLQTCANSSIQCLSLKVCTVYAQQQELDRNRCLRAQTCRPLMINSR